MSSYVTLDEININSKVEKKFCFPFIIIIMIRSINLDAGMKGNKSEEEEEPKIKFVKKIL